MKIHALVSAADREPARSSSHYQNLFVETASNQLALQAESGCIARCVGQTAATQCSYCGNDISCWESCAGPSRGSCVSQCFI